MYQFGIFCGTNPQKYIWTIITPIESEYAILWINSIISLFFKYAYQPSKGEYVDIVKEFYSENEYSKNRKGNSIFERISHRFIARNS